MSIQAIAWVLDHSKSTGSARCVLFAIANHIDHRDGEGWSYVKTVCREANVSLKTYYRAIHQLEALGELERDIKQGGNDKRKPDEQPNRFRMTRFVRPPQSDQDPPQTEVDNLTTTNGDRPGQSDQDRPLDRLTTTEPSYLDPSQKTEPSQDRALVVQGGFDAFWERYPRKVGKGDARKAFTRALRRAGSDIVILEALVRLLPGWSFRDPTMVPYPATWLNRDGWEDEADRPPAQPRPTPSEARNDRNMEATTEAIMRARHAGFVPAKEITR